MLKPIEYLSTVIQQQILHTLEQKPKIDHQALGTKELFQLIETKDASVDPGTPWLSISILWKSGDSVAKESLKSELARHLTRTCSVSKSASEKMAPHWLESLALMTDLLQSSHGLPRLALLQAVSSPPGSPELQFHSHADVVRSLSSDSPLVRLQACLRLAVDRPLAASHTGAIKTLLQTESLDAIRTLALKALQQCDQT